MALRKTRLSQPSEFEITYVYKDAVSRFQITLSPRPLLSHATAKNSPMSFALPARQVTFSRPNASTQQPYQPPQQPQYQPPQPHGIALPSGNPYNAPQQSSTGIALPGPSPLSNSYVPPQQPQQAQSTINKPSPTQQTAPATVVGPSTSSAPTPTPSTPAPLTLEQQHITAVEGIVPTLQNIVATVNLDCRLDLKTIALHARNAEYNPKVGT